MSDRATVDEEKEGREESAEEDGKRRPWLKWLLGFVALAVLAVVAVIVLGGSDKKAPPGGTLKAGKQQLLPLSPSGKLNAAPGQKVVGDRMAVRSIVDGRGFWVGGSRIDRVFVKYDGPRAAIAVPRVDLAGSVRPAPANVEQTLKLSREDAAKVTAEGAYIEASKVSPAH